MKSKVIIPFIILILAPLITADAIEDQIEKITYYAEQFESGTIDFLMLQVHLASARQGINEVLGAVNYEGGLIKQEQIRKALGEPTEETKWVWAGERDIKLDEYVPVWRKILFDGKKTRITLEAYPTIFQKKRFKKEFEHKDNFEDIDLGIEEGSIIYNLHFNIDFKKPQDQLDISGKIKEVKSLAEDFDSNPSESNAEKLAKESVNAERIFENYFRQNSGKCENVMSKIFGSENKRSDQKTLQTEITFFEDDKMDAIIWMESCEECKEWRYINLDMRLEGRGKLPRVDQGEGFRGKYKSLSNEQFKSKTREILGEVKNFLDSGEYGRAMSSSQELRMVTDAWNEKSNNVWEDVKTDFESEFKLMNDKERYEFDQSFGWLKKEQEERQKVQELQEKNYQERKSFYEDLFSGYEKRETYSEETRFEKRLIQTFRQGGEEMCSNNKDDNDNGLVDCSDDQCGGQLCGRATKTVEDGEETKEVEVNYYCIQKICQPKEEEIKPKGPVCGNHICEEGEADSATEEGTCQSDCTFAQCPEHPPIECSGEVVFKGKDKNGCNLEPICIEDKVLCETTEDCRQPLCGVAECVKSEDEENQGICKVTELKECKEKECTEGEKQTGICLHTEEEILTAICKEGEWFYPDPFCEVPPEKKPSLNCVKCGDSCISKEESTSALCEESKKDFNCYEDDGSCVVRELPPPVPMPIEPPVVGEECSIASDCGGKDDVCSNGKCVTIPKIIPKEPEPPQSSPETEQEDKSEEQIEKVEDNQEIEEESSNNEENSEESEEQSPESTSSEAPTGNVIKTITGWITGYDTKEENGGSSIPEPEPPQTSPQPEPSPEPEPKCPNPGKPPKVNQDCYYKENYDSDGCVSGYDVVCDNKEGPPRNSPDDDSDDREERDREERNRHEIENKERCEKDCDRTCYDKEIRPCTEKCIRDSCGDNLDCDIDEERKKCESSCKEETDTAECRTDCTNKCTSGEDNWWEDFKREPEEHKMEKGVFQVGGSCRNSKGRTDGFVWFGGWGDPFERIEPLKHKYSGGREGDWCKKELENVIKQRELFQKEFNQEFIRWFFEKHLANSAEDFMSHVSGIYEIYWNNVGSQMQLAHLIECSGKKNIVELMNIKLINVNYETEFGKIEYWEELKEVEMPELNRKVTLVSPYMKAWIFPNKNFMKYMMKESMKEHEFPGPPEEKLERDNEGGPTEKEREFIKQDRSFMKKITILSEEYGGTVDASVQFKDFESGELVFNLYVQINPDIIMTMEPMPLEEMPEVDITADVPFELIYEMISTSEKEMRGEHIEMPPWEERKFEPVKKVREITDGVKMYFKMRKIMSNTKISPESAEGDAKDIFKMFMKMMQKGDEREGRGPPIGDEETDEESFGGQEERRELGGEFNEKNEKGFYEEHKGKSTGRVIRGL